MDLEGICNTFDSGVWEPVSSKVNSFMSATEAAAMVLSVDETVRNPASQQDGGGGQGGPRGRPGGGMAGGKKMSQALGGGGMQSLFKGKGVRMMQVRPPPAHAQHTRPTRLGARAQVLCRPPSHTSTIATTTTTTTTTTPASQGKGGK